MRAFFLSLALSALAHGADAKVRLVEAGIICPEIRESTQRRDAPDTETGFIDIIDQQLEFDLPDRKVPLIQHLSFGLRVALKEGEPDTLITIVVEHPPTGPEAITRESWTQVIGPGSEDLNIFTFDYPYEMVPGLWTFSIEVDGAVQVSVPFDVGPAGSNPRVDAKCLGVLSS